MREAKPNPGIILLWKGPWRPWFTLWLESCRVNVTWTFYVISDSPQPEYSHKYSNVIFITINSTAFQCRLRKSLGFECEVPQGYKYCDFRPAFGLIFKDVLRAHSHWGYCDEDLFFGQLSNFLTDAALTQYDIVTSCRCSIVGQLTVLKNTEKCKTLFRKIPNIEHLLRDYNNHIIDETHLNQLCLELEISGNLSVLRRQFQTHDVHSEEWQAWADRLDTEEFGSPMPKMDAGEAEWREGKVYHAQSNKEYAFYHFGHWKRIWHTPNITELPSYIIGWRATKKGLLFLSDSPIFGIIYNLNFKVRSFYLQYGLKPYGQLSAKVLNRLRRLKAMDASASKA